MHFDLVKQFWCVLKTLFAPVLVAMLCACTTTSFQSRTPEYTGTTPVSAIYVYSFLDLRQGSLGKNFLAEVKRQLTDALAQDGIRTKQLWFNDSPLSGQFSLEATGPNPSNTTTRVPIEEVIKATQEDERVFGASHRLIVFPSAVMSANTGASFDIRWDLVDSQTNKVTWATKSFSYHTKWFLGDENPQKRAATFVQGLMAKLHKSKVIRSPDAQPGVPADLRHNAGEGR